MPELPEVETIRRTIAGKIEGKMITQADILLPRLIKWPSPHEFQALIVGKKINRLERRGKYLLFQLSDDSVMVIHLRMTGRIYYVTAGEDLDRFTRIIFRLNNNDKLIYADSRTLGTLYAMPANELSRISGLSEMGPEPLTDNFTREYLQAVMGERQGTVKAILLNQKLIGGLGNIYVDESLSLAGIHPKRPGGSLDSVEINKLYDAITQVIREAIAHNGTTFRDYRDGIGQKGSHQQHLYVYGRKAQPCRNCGTPIEKTEVAGRGTHFCPYCQH